MHRYVLECYQRATATGKAVNLGASVDLRNHVFLLFRYLFSCLSLCTLKKKFNSARGRFTHHSRWWRDYTNIWALTFLSIQTITGSHLLCSRPSSSHRSGYCWRSTLFSLRSSFSSGKSLSLMMHARRFSFTATPSFIIHSLNSPPQIFFLLHRFNLSRNMLLFLGCGRSNPSLRYRE